jgi:hypothetical protein
MSSKDSNALNKAEKEGKIYREERNVKRSEPHHMSTPNYRQLNKTPMSERQQGIASVIQFGQPAKDENQLSSKRNANQTKFPTKETHEEDPVFKLKPLSMEQRGPTNPLPKSNTTESTPMQKPFRNRFDHPLTARELHQLKLSQLKGGNQRNIQNLLAMLLEQSKQISNHLAETKQDAPRPPSSQVKSETKPSPPLPQSRKDIIEQDIQQAQSDLQFLQDEYPKKSQQEQQDALKRLRATYGAGPKSNPIHIQKAIRDKLQNLNDELQTI